METTSEKYLSQMLEGHERNVEQIDQAILGIELQLQQATAAREESVQTIADLKEILGLEEETEKPDLKLVTNSEE